MKYVIYFYFFQKVTYPSPSLRIVIFFQVWQVHSSYFISHSQRAPLFCRLKQGLKRPLINKKNVYQTIRPPGNHPHQNWGRDNPANNVSPKRVDVIIGLKRSELNPRGNDQCRNNGRYYKFPHDAKVPENHWVVTIIANHKSNVFVKITRAINPSNTNNL